MLTNYYLSILQVILPNARLQSILIAQFNIVLYYVAKLTDLKMKAQLTPKTVRNFL